MLDNLSPRCPHVTWGTSTNAQQLGVLSDEVRVVVWFLSGTKTHGVKDVAVLPTVGGSKILVEEAPQYKALP